MLRALRIRGLAVAKDVGIELDNGFSVLTGETGAGKSILLDGLGFILGDRFSKEMMRPGEERASVGAIFSGVQENTELSALLDEIGVAADAEGEIEIVRTFNSDGRSTAKINGTVVSLTSLKEIGERLVNISSQSDNRMLGQRSSYLEMLDTYAELEGDRAVYEKDYKEYLTSVKELVELEQSLRDKVMLTDIYMYQLKEIDDVRLSDPDEEDKLEKQKIRLKDSERINKYASMVMRALARSENGATASYMIERAQHAIDNLADTVENAAELSQRLESIRFELIDIADQVYDITETDSEDPEAKLDSIESRLAKIAALEKKYGASITEILDYRASVAEKLDAIESGDLALKKASAKVEALYSKAASSADILSNKRKENAERLSSIVTETLKYLDIPKGIFSVKVSPRTAADGKYDLSSDGYDNISFMFTANSGYPLQELFKVASGGELSRTLLALKCAMSEKQDVPTVVFDEIDTGVSGATSERIGMKLKELSKRTQVICVTHSPQVASLSDTHFLIKKTDNGSGAESVVLRLDEEERVAEIARIIGGVKVTPKQIQAAKEMLEKRK